MTDQLHFSRRHALRLLLASGLAVFCSDRERPWAEPATHAGHPFSIERLRERARLLAAHEYRGPDTKLPAVLADMTVEQYRQIRFRPEQALWAEQGKFTAEFFHLGSYYNHPVRVFAVVDGNANEIQYSPALFDYGDTDLGSEPLPETLGYAGFRVHATLNTPDYFDELIAFLGASYFRALGRGMRYGISARGIALGTATSDNEEFPAFREFYLEKPVDNHSMVIHALLDGPSVVGAYTFTIRPGVDTIVDVNLTLYPRTTLTTVGLAALTSMFFFAANDRVKVDDFRPAVHDSDGLMVLTGAGEWLWRPVVNPERLRISSFVDHNPKGFGLMQRDRDFANYQDLDARYELRPSVWVEPVGDWGPGAVMLIEIPTDRESNDNLVAFWRPAEPLIEKREWQFTYRLHWCSDAPSGVEPRPAQVASTRIGRAKGDDGGHHFVLDFAGGQLPGNADGQIDAVVSASRGAVLNVQTHFNEVTKGWRVSFNLSLTDEEPSELRCFLKVGDKAISETWSYQWSS